MRNLILAWQLLGFAVSSERSESSCFETRDGLTCDLNSLSIVSEHLRSIFEEIYENAPVDIECIRRKSSNGEMNLALSMAHEDDKSDDIETLEQLFELMRLKVMSCYDSEVFVKRLMMMYERMQSLRVKNCIKSIVMNGSSDLECAQLSDKLYEKFSIDELFLATPSIVRVSSLNSEAHKCIKRAENRPERLSSVLALIVNEKSSLDDEEKKKNRENFKKFYESSLDNLSKCFKSADNTSFLSFNFVKIFDSVIRANLNIAIGLSILAIFMLFVKFLEKRASYEELP